MRAGPGSHPARMPAPILVRELSGQERARLEAAVRAPSAFTVRRAQIVLASAAGRRPREIARDPRCAAQAVRNGIRAFDAEGVGALEAGSSRPRSAAPVLGGAERERCARSCTSRRAPSAEPGAPGRSIAWRGWRTSRG